MKRKHGTHHPFTSRFTFREWHWTLPHENLFDLDAEALFIYRAIIAPLA